MTNPPSAVAAPLWPATDLLTPIAIAVVSQVQPRPGLAAGSSWKA
jgi:hypothetical protein